MKTLISAYVKNYVKGHGQANKYYANELRKRLEEQIKTDNDPYGLTQDDVEIILAAVFLVHKINAKVWTWVINTPFTYVPKLTIFGMPNTACVDEEVSETNVSPHKEETSP